MTYFEYKEYIIILALHNPNSFPEGRFYLLLKSLQMSEIFSLMGQSLWGAIFYNSVFETAFFERRVGMCEIGENEYELTADRASSRINNVCHKSFSRPKAVNGGSRSQKNFGICGGAGETGCFSYRKPQVKK